MPWSELTADEVKSRVSGKELTLLQTQSLAAGQSDPLAAIITQVIEEIRGYIAAWPNNAIGLAGTIPAQLKSAAIAIVRWRLIGRVSIGSDGGLLSAPARKAEYEDAMKLLERIAEGKMSVEQPSELGTQQGKEPLPGYYGGLEKLDFF